MRFVALLLPLPLLGAAPPAQTPAPSARAMPAPLISAFPACKEPVIARGDSRPGLRRLNELPPANAYQAVLRAGPDGCPDPLLVSERIGWDRPKAGN
jgi:hypothetical protein